MVILMLRSRRHDVGIGIGGVIYLRISTTGGCDDGCPSAELATATPSSSEYVLVMRSGCSRSAAAVVMMRQHHHVLLRLQLLLLLLHVCVSG